VGNSSHGSGNGNRFDSHGHWLNSHSNSFANFPWDLLVDGVAYLTRNRIALLDGDLDRDGPGNINALGDRLVDTVGFRHLSVDGGALGDGLRLAHGLGYLSGDDSALLPGNIHADGDGHTPGDSNLSGDLHRDLSALPLSNGLADWGLGSHWNWSSNSNWGCNCNLASRQSRSNSTSKRTKPKESIGISIGIGISISISISISLVLGVNKSSGNGSSNNGGDTSDSSGDTGNNRGTHSSSSDGSSHGSTNSMSNNSRVRLNGNLGLSAGLSGDVLALLGVGGVNNGLCLGGALLLGGTLLLLHGGALLLRDLLDDVGALGNVPGGTLLLRNILYNGGTLRDRGSGTLLLTLGDEVGGGLCAADRLVSGGAGLPGHSLVGGVATGSMGNVVTVSASIMSVVTVAGLSIRLGFSQEGGHKANNYQKLLHCDLKLMRLPTLSWSELE